MTNEPPHAPGDLAGRLVAEQQRFLAFLRRRLTDPATAEDILQAAYVKVLTRGDSVRDDESVVAWFYRVLRHALIDHHRRVDARRRAVDRATAAAGPASADPDDGLHDAVCACVGRLLGTLRADQADLLRRVEIEGEAVAAVAGRLGITAGNASVRLHRARQALRERVEGLCGACSTHGCLACTCRGPATGGRARV